MMYYSHVISLRVTFNIFWGRSNQKNPLLANGTFMNMNEIIYFHICSNQYTANRQSRHIKLYKKAEALTTAYNLKAKTFIWYNSTMKTI